MSQQQSRSDLEQRVDELEAENQELKGKYQELGAKIGAAFKRIERLEERARPELLDTEPPEVPEIPSGDGEKSLYIIRHPHDVFKIGVSAKPAERLKQLQTASPYQLALFAIHQPENASAAETLFHQRYEDYHVRGEWYDLPMGAAREIEEMCDLGGKQLQARLKDPEDRRREILTMQGLIG